MSSHEDGQRSDTVSPSRPPQAKVRRKPYQEGRQRIERKARTVQEERHELIHLINAHIDKVRNLPLKMTPDLRPLNL